MGRKKDRERAQNGQLFRDGKYVTREELEKGQPKVVSPEEAVKGIEEAFRLAGVPVVGHGDLKITLGNNIGR